MYININNNTMSGDRWAQSRRAADRKFPIARRLGGITSRP